jgi:hypothetical protein
MPRRSPTWEGFRSLFRRPLLGAAETAWRWVFGVSATVLLTFAFLAYVNTLPVSRGDLILVRSGQPALIWQALRHIIHGSWPRAVRAGFVLISALGVAWITVASLGRAVTLASVLGYVRSDEDTHSATIRWGLRSLSGLHLLRLTATFAAGLGLLAAWRLAAAASPDRDPSPGSAVLVFLTVVMFVAAAWLVVNWFLSFATLFVQARGANTLGAIGAAADLCRDHPGPVLAVTAWFSVAHLVAFFLATSAVGFPLAFLAVLPAGMVLGGVLALSLFYFAVVDFLYIGRLVAYAMIAEGPERSSTEPIAGPLAGGSPMIGAPPLGPPVLGRWGEDRVDPEELILSDLPASVET